jgi:hypothetical protein
LPVTSSQDTEPKYIYGVVRAGARAIDAPGIGQRPLGVVRHQKIGALTSDAEFDQIEVGRDEIMAHAQALERALEHGPVLPMRFGVVMESEQAVRDQLLAPHRAELEAQLDEMEDKVEVNVKGIYDEPAILREVVAEDREVAQLKEITSTRTEAASYPERIRLGELIGLALEDKRAADSAAIIERLAKHAVAVDVGEAVHERMAVNCSFLIKRAELDKFDRALDALADGQGGRIRFKYAGPLPPHSFVELSLES